MSKRLQVLLPDSDYKDLQRLVRSLGLTMAEWVRGAIRLGVNNEKPRPAEERLAQILKYSKFRGPTGSIEDLLKQIEMGQEE